MRDVGKSILKIVVTLSYATVFTVSRGVQMRLEQRQAIEMHVRRRFPRLEGERDESNWKFLSRLRQRYPLPVYRWQYDGSTNPGVDVLTGLLDRSKKQLRRYAHMHALDEEGSRFQLIKRLYLHWRSSRLQLGKRYIGYGKHHQSTRTPTCICGFRRRADVLEEQEQKRLAMLNGKTEKARVLALWAVLHKKLYDLQNGIKQPRRFPRLETGKDGKVRFPRPE